ncbi:MAG TPA: efflux RND transporter periplasmic adaptor subunit [Gallionella sp.]|nr:efflux RND transporter periplasmic adaptor subunit [Gallionella sp.]
MTMKNNMSHIARMDKGRLALLMLAGLSGLAGCNKSGAPPQMQPPEISVMKVSAAPVTVFEEFTAQTEAVDTVEIRARVGGILERQGFADGAHVKKGDLLFVIDQQPFIAALTQAKANLALAEASALNSRQNLERAKPLFADHAISKQELDAAVAKDAADAAAVEAAKAQLEQARLNLDYTTLRAPRDGVMSKALVKRGGLVNASTTLLDTLYSEDPIYVNFTLSDQKAAELDKSLKSFAAKGQETDTVFKLKLVDGSDYRHGGKLDFMDAAFDPRTGTQQVRISVPNPERTLKSGQFVHVTLPAFEVPQAIRVPQRAVLEMQGNRMVFVIGADNKAVPRDIVAMRRIGNEWIVEHGLSPGERIVVEGMSKIRPGSLVKPTEAGPAKSPG